VVGSTIIVSLFIFSSVLYFRSADARLLDLSHPSSDKLRCFRPSDDCMLSADVTSCMLSRRRTITHGLRVAEMNSTCPADQLPVSNCYNVSLPLQALNGNLSLQTLDSFNSFGIWSLIFGIMGLAVAGVILVHDMAMLSETSRARILAMVDLDEATPCYWRVILACQCRGQMRSLRRKSPAAFWSVLPLWVIAQAVLFLLVMLPLTLLAFFCGRCVELSRLMVFFVSICVAIWNVIGFLWWVFWDTEYLVPWDQRLPDNSVCMCLCGYHLDFSTRLHIWSLNVIFLWQAIGLVLRSLKGLRRQQWASLLSVLYTVPTQVYPVRWRQPDGQRVRWRKDFDSVQEEPAFDPFALMDEQPESGQTKVVLRPVPMTKAERAKWASRGHEAEIGYCGFPRAQNPEQVQDDSGASREEAYRLIDPEEAFEPPSDDDDNVDIASETREKSRVSNGDNGKHHHGEDLTEEMLADMSLPEAKMQLVEAHALIRELRQQIAPQVRVQENPSAGDGDDYEAREYYGA